MGPFWRRLKKLTIQPGGQQAVCKVSPSLVRVPHFLAIGPVKRIWHEAHSANHCAKETLREPTCTKAAR